ncbi:MAG: hypothetical protein JHC31_11375 [Sulfurihydrogenibium sp.]|jgi:hypothetical protein|nr:hypothetical protein [Sulfurihydrogenibium sp.]
MAKIYSDASLVEFADYKIGSWCSIISLGGAKISLQGKCIKKEADINDLEYRASINAILFAVKTLQIKPEDLIAFIDNKSAYSILKRNEFSVRVKFIGGERKDNIRDGDKYFYHLCDRISRRITSDLVEKSKKQIGMQEMEEEKVGVIKTINDIPEFIEREIEPIVIEKIRTAVEPEYKGEIGRSLDALLEDSINEYINNKRILTVVRTVKTNGQIYLYLSAKELIQAVKLKRMNEIKRKILCYI